MRIVADEEVDWSRGPGRPSKYPWKTWLVSGQTVELFKGDDYEVPTENMRVQIRKAAERHGGTVVTGRLRDPEGIRLSFRRNLTQADVDEALDDIGEIRRTRTETDPEVARMLAGESLQP